MRVTVGFGLGLGFGRGLVLGLDGYTKGRNEGGHAGAEAGGARASAAVVDDRRNLGEEPLVRDAAGDEHVLGRPRRNLGRVGLGGVELVEAETEELAAARPLKNDPALTDGVQRAHLCVPNGEGARGGDKG